MSGIRESKHSRRSVPRSRSHRALAWGLRTGVLRILRGLSALPGSEGRMTRIRGVLTLLVLLAGATGAWAGWTLEEALAQHVQTIDVGTCGTQEDRFSDFTPKIEICDRTRNNPPGWGLARPRRKADLHANLLCFIMAECVSTDGGDGAASGWV